MKAVSKNIAGCIRLHFCLSPVLEVTMQRPCLAVSRHEPSCPRIAQVDTEKDEETHKSTGAASEDLTCQGLVGNKGIFYIKIVQALSNIPLFPTKNE